MGVGYGCGGFRDLEAFRFRFIGKIEHERGNPHKAAVAVFGYSGASGFFRATPDLSFAMAFDVETPMSNVSP
jgi:hypothetical protein